MNQRKNITLGRKEQISAVFKKELKSYFNSPIAYIFLAVFNLFSNFLFFYMPNFWEIGSASMSQFFHVLKFTYIFFIPAITMRLWAEEKQLGNLEITFTLPLSNTEIILGKFFAALSFLAIALASTLLIPITLITIARPDISLIFGGYLAALFFGAAFIALGMYISWKSSDQITAFLLTFVIGFFLVMLGYPPVLNLAILSWLGQFKPLLASFSFSWHFDSITRGMLDSRDIIYFLLFTFTFLYLNQKSIEQQR